ncbi:MAG: PRC-barrel domain-containing protein [Verrucomicrobiota bacterium]|nr:PRC-barrel domain-containing protein [Verrucomicrobiota bacterium]
MLPRRGLIAATAQAQKAPHKFDGQLVRSSNLIGADLFTTTGDDIGEINDVVLDENSGTVMYPALSAGGFLGIGDKLTLVSWKSIEVKKQDDKLRA